MSQKLLLVALTLFFAVAIQAESIRYVANLSGQQAIPANNSTGKGVCLMSFDEIAQFYSYRCTYDNLPSGSYFPRFHIGASVGETAPVFLDTFFSVVTNGPGEFAGAIPNLTAEQIAALRSNRWYINFASPATPNNEIRGQFHVANGAYNDFDGDGRTDLTVYRNSNNTFYTLGSLTENLTEKQIGQPGDSVSLTVDFDGDGRSDFSTARYNSEVLWRIFKSSTGTLEETRWGNSTLGDFFAAADYDGDGAFDIAVYRAGVWYIIESSTGNARYAYFGLAGDVPAPNDFDKDGKADLAVARSENGQRVWHILRSSDGVYYSLHWGLSSDAFFTGRTDWDGDGAADVTVIRNQSGQRVFYILRSSDLQMHVVYWGLSSDVVKLGDYDGDGKTDAAVTRAQNGQRVFYILQSSNGQPRYATFGLAGDF